MIITIKIAIQKGGYYLLHRLTPQETKTKSRGEQ